MKRYGIVTVAALFLALIGAGCGGDSKSPAAREDPATSAASPADVVEVRIGNAQVRSEVADDDAERARGLGGRARLGRDAGMYFVLVGDSPRFWMKGMRFGLDIIWIRGGRVVDLSARVPPPRAGTSEARLPIYSPRRPANRALEVRSGWAARHGVGVGDRVSIATVR